jgi:hypothetical protein
VPALPACRHPNHDGAGLPAAAFCSGAVALGPAVIAGAAASVTASLIRTAAPQALTAGYDAGMAVSAGITLIAVLLAVTVIRAPRPADEPRGDTSDAGPAGPGGQSLARSS